jgi:hypothetical protein
MIEGWSVVTLALGYVSVLFAVAWYADRNGRFSKASAGRPLIYALSLAVYCTSWTFFGSVGLAAATGYDFIPVYLGPILLFVFGWRLLARIVRLAKSQNITSVADFLAARYGKSQAVAAIVTVIAVAGTLPAASTEPPHGYGLDHRSGDGCLRGPVRDAPHRRDGTPRGFDCCGRRRIARQAGRVLDDRTVRHVLDVRWHEWAVGSHPREP